MGVDRPYICVEEIYNYSKEYKLVHVFDARRAGSRKIMPHMTLNRLDPRLMPRLHHQINLIPRRGHRPQSVQIR